MRSTFFAKVTYSLNRPNGYVHHNWTTSPSGSHASQAESAMMRKPRAVTDKDAGITHHYPFY